MDQQAPGLIRRLACFVYEGMLLFAVAMAAGLVFSPLVNQRDAMMYRGGLMTCVGTSYAAYFIYFWTHGGQTLPMKTWRIRLVTMEGSAVTAARALLRFVLSLAWWVLPALSFAQMRQHGVGLGPISLVVVLGLLAYAMLSFILPGRQFLHDMVCRTRLVNQARKGGGRP